MFHQFNSGGYDFGVIWPIGGSTIGATEDSGLTFVTVIDAGTSIGASTAWLAGNIAKDCLSGDIKHNMGISLGGNFAPWGGVSHKYVAMKIQIGDNHTGAFHYGWVEASLNAACTVITLHGYAYHKTAETAIDAGDKGISVAPAVTNLVPR